MHIDESSTDTSVNLVDEITHRSKSTKFGQSMDERCIQMNWCTNGKVNLAEWNHSHVKKKYIYISILEGIVRGWMKYACRWIQEPMKSKSSERNQSQVFFNFKANLTSSVKEWMNLRSIPMNYAPMKKGNLLRWKSIDDISTYPIVEKVNLPEWNLWVKSTVREIWSTVEKKDTGAKSA